MNQELTQYEAPAVIYEGNISTRAGSAPIRGGGEDSIQPIDLFNE